MADAVPSVLALDARLGPIAALSERLGGLDMSSLLVYLVDLVDASALPHLAEQFHVMGSEGWSWAQTDSARRSLIKAAIELHRYKGTPWAIKHALTRLGLSQVTLIERPQGAHWAEFDVDVSITDRPLSEEAYALITELVDTYKPVRSHLRKLTVSMSTSGSMYIACATIAGDTVEIYPYQTPDLTFPSALFKSAIGLQDWGTTTIYPRPA